MITILLIEDSLLLRERLRSKISGIQGALLVAEADNEDDALSYLEIHRPDLAIIDLHLKSGTGLSLIEHIKDAYAATTMVVLTNLVEPEYRVKCKALGAHYFFDKSKDGDQIITLLGDLSKKGPETVSYLADVGQRNRPNSS